MSVSSHIMVISDATQTHPTNTVSETFGLQLIYLTVTGLHMPEAKHKS